MQHPVICTDTRKITPGCFFVALKGNQFDGNSFADQALKIGAAFALVSDPAIRTPKTIFVEDTLITLQQLANHHRRKLAIPLIAITGTNGKTTTKELISRVLSSTYKVHATAGNFNNHIGVPLTLLGTPEETEIIICEMGANHVGEINLLCEIAEPTCGIITNIGRAHLEGFGSIEGVQKAKGELFNYLQMHGGFAFVNWDDSRLRKLAEGLTEKITFGFDRTLRPDVQFDYSTQDDNGITIESEKENVRIHSEMFGSYNASNMLAAYVVGRHFNIDKGKIIHQLSSYIPAANRSETIAYKGCTIIKDAYNANPSSMEMALRSFAQRFQDGWVILGDMKELGSETEQAHLEMIRLLGELKLQHAYLVGTAFKTALKNYNSSFTTLVAVDQIDELKSIWNWKKCEGKTLLLKGSRSMSLEKILE
jgi:UDP-N-acetylmuramoyl-tripeptide--D-alanyl-D-alanine ligase